MASLPLWLTLLIFVAAAVAVWIAGISLSNQTDVLSTRLHLGAALGGTVLLAVATNLPEIAITVSAALSGNVGVAVGNISWAASPSRPSCWWRWTPSESRATDR